MKKVVVGVIGTGVVGCGVATLLVKRRAEFKKQYGVDFVLKTVCDLKPPVQALKKIGGSFNITKKSDDILNDPDIHIVAELIGGLHPAKEFIAQALKNGKDVVTANKAVISNFGQELFALARQHGRSLYYESAVLAGVPIIKTITEGIAGNRYDGLLGILNGTCNYILSEMTSAGLSFDEALKLAQQKGYAESDPTLDINGMDTAHKLAILVSLAMGKFINVKEIHTEGITHISHADIEFAEEMGWSIKLLAIAKKTKGGVDARVHPTLLPKSHPMAKVDSVINACYLEADPLGDVMLQGAGAGQMAAASGVISDMVNLAVNENHQWFGNHPEDIHKLVVEKVDKVVTEYYVRLMVADKPGVLSKITGIFGKFNISIASMTQKEKHATSAVPLVFLTHEASEASMMKALATLKMLPEVKAKPVAIRMER